jgi:large subunit ribosomal protein L4
MTAKRKTIGPTAPVFSAAGERVGEQALPAVLFDGLVHETAMWQAVKAALANRRQATASTKTRAQVAGGNSKPWRQKGTGRARQGSIRSPHWRGGGSVFGPRPGRNYSEAIPRRIKWLARRSAYNARAQDGAVVLVEPIQMDAPKTKTVAALLDAVGARGNALLLTNGLSPTLYLSARNLPGVQVRPFGEEAAYDVLWADTVIIETTALERAAEVAHA